MKELAAMGEKQFIVTMGRNGLSFNFRTADVLRRTAFVRVLLNAETEQLAVQAAPTLGPQSTPFFRPEVFKSNRIKINSRSMVQKIRAVAGWEEESTWNIAGVYSSNDDAIILSHGWSLLLKFAPQAVQKNMCITGPIPVQ